MAGSQDLTIGAAALPVFLTKTKRRTWAKRHPLLSLLMNDKITSTKEDRTERIQTLRNDFGEAQKYRIPVELYELSNGGLMTRGSTITFAVEDVDVYGEIGPKHYTEPWALATTDLDVQMPARGNEAAVSAVASRMISAAAKLADRMATYLVEAAQTSGGIESLVATMFKGSGTSTGIAATTHATWIANVTSLSGDRLLIDTAGSKVRELRAAGKDINVIVCGQSVGEMLLSEAKSTQQQVVDLMEAFGKNAEGQPSVYLETSYETIKIAGCPVIMDPYLEASAPGTVLMFDRSAVGLSAARKANFKAVGPKDVSLEAGADQTRGMVRLSCMTYTFDRTSCAAFTDAAN